MATHKSEDGITTLRSLDSNPNRLQTENFRFGGLALGGQNKKIAGGVEDSDRRGSESDTASEGDAQDTTLAVQESPSASAAAAAGAAAATSPTANPTTQSPSAGAAGAGAAGAAGGSKEVVDFTAEFIDCYLEFADELLPDDNELNLSAKSYVAYMMLLGLPWS